MQAIVDTTKTRSLGWVPQRALKEDIAAFVRGTKPEPAPDRRILVFTTTFHPISGPAEDALCELMIKLPDVHFDIITAAHAKEALDIPCIVANGTVYRVGFGNRFDKFLLPFFGTHKALSLAEKHKYLFSWSIMASYGTLPALIVRNGKLVPLLVTLADQDLSWYERLFLRLILSQTDQVHTSTP